jgi:outer membrane protein assembly factor BamA
MQAVPRRVYRLWLLAAVLVVIGRTGSLAEAPSDSTWIIRHITLAGNKITKDHIILRELTFHAGDTLQHPDSTFLRSEENLLNTSLFLKAEITRIAEGNQLDVFIFLSERWYIFPVPIFEVVDRNFNEWWVQKDFSRVNYGAYLYWNNFRGRNETFTFAFRTGYTHRFSLYYEIPFINRKQKAGLIFAASYSTNKETAYATATDKLQYLKLEGADMRTEQGYSVQYTFRPGLYVTHLLEAGYRQADVLDTVVRLNPGFFAGSSHTEKYSILRYAFRIDHRDIKPYPLRGNYFDVEVIKNGLDVFHDDIDLFFLAANYRRYVQLGHRWYASGGLNGKVSGSSFQPYYNTRALGYSRDFVRGYEYYVIDGQDYLLGKSNLKFELLPKKFVHAGLIPFEKFATIPFAFYLNLYADAAYVNDAQFAGDWNNRLPNTWLFGYGAGIDLVTYYDMVFRFEYSLNKFGESGIFIHFTAPI